MGEGIFFGGGGDFCYTGINLKQPSSWGQPTCGDIISCLTAGCRSRTRIGNTAGSRMKVSRLHSGADQLSEFQLRNTF